MGSKKSISISFPSIEEVSNIEGGMSDKVVGKHSDLEVLVNNDMVRCGFNPLDPVDIKAYWAKKLK